MDQELRLLNESSEKKDKLLTYSNANNSKNRHFNFILEKVSTGRVVHTKFDEQMKANLQVKKQGSRTSKFSDMPEMVLVEEKKVEVDTLNSLRDRVKKESENVKSTLILGSKKKSQFGTMESKNM